VSNLPKLSDLQDPRNSENFKNNPTDTTLMSSEEIEILNVKNTYELNMSNKRREITLKIDELEKKIQKHSIKEGMLDKIITQTSTELDNLSPNEFTRRGQKQSALIKQLEALGVLQDTLMKYEDMIQKYHKIVMDIDNNKLNGFIKIQNLSKEEEEVDEGLGSVLQDIQSLLKGGGATSGSNPVLDDLQRELLDGDY